MQIDFRKIGVSPRFKFLGKNRVTRFSKVKTEKTKKMTVQTVLQKTKAPKT
jgi:hypothetical protein